MSKPENNPAPNRKPDSKKPIKKVRLNRRANMESRLRDYAMSLTEEHLELALIHSRGGVMPTEQSSTKDGKWSELKWRKGFRLVWIDLTVLGVLVILLFFWQLTLIIWYRVTTNPRIFKFFRLIRGVISRILLSHKFRPFNFETWKWEICYVIIKQK